MHFWVVDFVCRLVNSFGISMVVCLEIDFMVSDTCIGLIWNWWYDVKFGTTVRESAMTFGFIVGENDFCFIIHFSIASWVFRVRFTLHTGIEGPVRGSVIGVGFIILVAGRCCFKIRTKVE
jgi:hypothetical protein